MSLSINHYIAHPLLLLAALMISGCESMYYKTMEQVGVHKRDILVDRVEGARDAQQDGKEQFQSALEKFSDMLNYSGGDLEATYDKLNREYENSQTKAERVSARIDDVENVAGDLFDEWDTELDQYSSAQLRNSSEQKLRDTRRHYSQMITAMRKAESKMAPVLAALKDQVLYLKHNLNAAAISSLQQEFSTIKVDISALIQEMETSIDEADAFLQTLG